MAQYQGKTAAEQGDASFSQMMAGIASFGDAAKWFKEEQYKRKQDSIAKADEGMKLFMQQTGLQTLADVANTRPTYFNKWAKLKWDLTDEEAENMRKETLAAPPTVDMFKQASRMANATETGETENAGGAPPGTVPASYETPEGPQAEAPVPKPKAPEQKLAEPAVAAPAAPGAQPFNLASFDQMRKVAAQDPVLGPAYNTYDALQKRYAGAGYKENEGTQEHPRIATFTAGIGKQMQKDIDAKIKSLEAALEGGTYMTGGQKAAVARQIQGLKNMRVQVEGDIARYTKSMADIDTKRKQYAESIAQQRLTGARGEVFYEMSPEERARAATNPNMSANPPVSAPPSVATESYAQGSAPSAQSAPAPAPSAPAAPAPEAPAAPLTGPQGTDTFAKQFVASKPSPRDVRPYEQSMVDIVQTPANVVPASAEIRSAAPQAGVGKDLELPEKPSIKDTKRVAANANSIYAKSMSELLSNVSDPAERRRILEFNKKQVQEPTYWDRMVSTEGTGSDMAQIANRGPIADMLRIKLAEVEASLAQSKAIISQAELGVERARIEKEVADIEKNAQAASADLAKTLGGIQLQNAQVELAIAKQRLLSEQVAQKDTKSKLLYEQGKILYDVGSENLLKSLAAYTVTNKQTGTKELDWKKIAQTPSALAQVNAIHKQINQGLNLMSAASGIPLDSSLYMPELGAQEMKGAGEKWRKFWKIKKMEIYIKNKAAGMEGPVEGSTAGVAGGGGGGAAPQNKTSKESAEDAFLRDMGIEPPPKAP